MTRGERRALAAIVAAFWAGLRPEPLTREHSPSHSHRVSTDDTNNLPETPIDNTAVHVGILSTIFF